MSTAPTEYEHLLSEAVNQAKAKAPRATDDLFRFSSRAAEAVDSVTGGAAALELVPMNSDGSAAPTYQLQLRKVGSEAPPSDLGVYSLSPAGYPVRHWYSRTSWEFNQDRSDGTYHNVTEMEGHFRSLVSDPDSRLVFFVSFFQQTVSVSTSSDAEPR